MLLKYSYAAAILLPVNVVQQEIPKKVTNVRKNFTIFYYTDIFYANQSNLTPAHSMTKNLFSIYFTIIITFTKFHVVNLK